MVLAGRRPPPSKWVPRPTLQVRQGGQLFREEEDRNGDGRADLRVHYLRGEVVERHEDLDYDGTTDVTSYYENGKLVRREIDSERAIEQWSKDPGS